MKILTIIGARPQFIKMAAVSRIFQNCAEIEEIIIHTGQHYDQNMSDVFFTELAIPLPQYNLGIGDCSHGAMTGRQMEAIEKLLIKEKPDWVLVYGDTNSTLAGTLAAVKLNIPVAHVEAGLRSYNRKMPEEINRVLVDHAASLFFAPTIVAVENLNHEGIDKSSVILSGDVMYDAAIFYANKAEQRKSLLSNLEVNAGGYALLTFHRAENTDVKQTIQNIVEALVSVSKNLPVILPLHPRTRKILEKFNLLTELLDKLIVIEPVSYLEMVLLEKYASVVITDSGGVQKEAYFHQVPCVTLRKETEWVELVDNGWNKLVDPASENIYEAIMKDHKPMPWTPLYGDGDASNKILKGLLEFDRIL